MMMKKIQRNSFFAFFLAALLITALITSCSPDVPEPYAPLEGHGSVQLTIDGISNLRTILPNVTVGDFQSYKLIFTATSGAPAESKTEDVLAANITNPISLVPGTYSLEVIAFMQANWTQPAADFNTSGDITITENANTNINIVLTAYSPSTATENGTFSWDITTTDITGLVTATMTITPGSSVIDLTTNGNSLQPLTAGYYSVVFQLVKNDPLLPVVGQRTFTFQQALWIYQYMTSSFTFTFTDDHFGLTPLTVTFDANGGDPPISSTQVLPGGVLPSLPTPDRAGYTFEGWWTQDGSGNQWGEEFTTSTVVNADITVYARWLQDGTATPGGPTLDPVGGTPITLESSVQGAGQITLANGGTVNATIGDSVVITVTNDSAYTGITWQWNNQTLDTGASLTIDNASANVNTAAAGTFVISVQAEEVTGNAPQSSFFTLNITP